MASALESGDELFAGQLAAPIAFQPSGATCGDVFNWLLDNPAVPATAVLDEEGHVMGLVNRLVFFAHYARQYSPELFSRKSILKLANTQPLLVDEKVRIADLGALLLDENPGAISECFVVTSGGRYLGVGTAEALLRSKVCLMQVRERELSRALEAARESGKSKSDFLALMSHELRTPLNAIIGFSEVLSGEMFGPLGHDRYREYSGDIHGAGRHLLALINDILDLSKAEAGKFELACEDVAPGGLIMECLRLMRGRAMDAGLQLVHAVAPAMPDLLVDRLRTKQILLNLLSNAIKFTPRGGQVRVEARGGAEEGAVISVRDTGIGMAPEMIPRALEPFRQIASPLSRKEEGTGLGLALVKSLIELHGGRIEIDSAPQQGTDVRLIFPANRVQTAHRRLSA